VHRHRSSTCQHPTLVPFIHSPYILLRMPTRSFHFTSLLAAACTLVFTTTLLHAVEDEEAAKARAAAGIKPPTKGSEMQYGPVLSYSVDAPPATPGAKEAAGGLPKHVASKGLIIKLGEKDEGYVCFDTDTLRMAAGWTGGFLKLSKTNIGTYKGDGSGAGEIAGDMIFRTMDAPAWVLDDSVDDPRPAKAGPIPKSLGHFKGHYLNGNRVILSYEVGGCDILESPDFLRDQGKPVFLRNFTVGPSQKPMVLRLSMTNAELSLSESGMGPNVGKLAFRKGGAGLAITFPAHQGVLQFTVGTTPTDPAGTKVHVAPNLGPLIDLPPLTKGGPARWPDVITAPGTLGDNKGAYTVDTIPVPEANPWKSWMRLSAVDFFSDGRAAVCTLNGDVWIVSGLDAKLDQVTWKRFAAGLYEPMGLRIVKDVVYVHGRDQITRLHDLNNDGEADFYECFNSDRILYPSYHAFAFDLQTDSKGNFYYVVGGNQLGAKRDWHASVFRVSPDGLKTDIVATGFRAPNGMTVGPHDEIAVGDNQGHWTPSSKVSLVKPGGFYGHVADPRVDAKAPAPATFDPPICWIPMTMDSSTGGQVWATGGGKWGPLDGHLLSTSYGKSALLAILDEKVDGIAQGGAISLPLKFASGIMRPRFNPKDGQLYVVGLKGWQTNAIKDGCFQRVRYTGQPLRLPTELHAKKDQITITFPEPLATAEANDPGSFGVQAYNYKWWSTYGSPDFKLSNPTEKGRDTLDVKAATLSSDGKTVTLTIPGLQPAMQMEIKLNLRAADGTPIQTTIGSTINKLP